MRFITEVDCKDSTHVQTRRLEGLRPIGEVVNSVENLEKQGFKEFALNSVVATLYSKPVQAELISQVRSRIFGPILYMGGIRSVEDAKRVIDSGADRIGLNSALFEDPRLLNSIESKLGGQSVVLQVDFTKVDHGWRLAHSSGREITRHELLEWVPLRLQDFSGEALVTCIDTQGTGKGFPLDVVELLAPWQDRVILSGGLRGESQILEISKEFPGFSFSSSNVCLVQEDGAS